MSELQAQCWTCPHCHDDKHHEPGDSTCLENIKRQRDQLQQDIQEMVKKAADKHLDGYRELGQRTADAEDKLDATRAHNKRTMDVLAEVMMAIDDGDLGRIPFEKVRTIYNETPEQALRDARSEAGREEWVCGVRGGLKAFQRQADIFNENYAKATHTSQPADWRDAALSARQLVNSLHAHKVIEDSWERLDREWREDSSDG